MGRLSGRTEKQLFEAAKRNLVHLENNDRGGGYSVSMLKPASTKKEPIIIPTFESETTKSWNEMLLQQGINITNHLIRHTVVHEFVDHVLERRVLKKRSTLLFTIGDIARRCRKTSPEASIAEVEHILMALKNSGQLFGLDNTPIRSKRANFTIHKDAEDLLASLRSYYLVELLKHTDLNSINTNLESLSELLWNDKDHTEGLAETISTLSEQIPPTKAEIVPEQEPKIEPVDESTEVQPEPKPKKKRAPRKKTAKTAASDKESPAKPKPKRTRKKASTVETTPDLPTTEE